MARISKIQRSALRSILADLERAAARIESPTVVITAPSEDKMLSIKNTDQELAKLAHSISNLAHFLIYN